MYDRQLLLSGAKRNAVLDLHEVKRYGLNATGENHGILLGTRRWVSTGSTTTLTGRLSQ